VQEQPHNQHKEPVQVHSHHSKVPVLEHSKVPVLEHSKVPVLEHSKVPVPVHSKVPVLGSKARVRRISSRRDVPSAWPTDQLDHHSLVLAHNKPVRVLARSIPVPARCTWLLSSLSAWRSIRRRRKLSSRTNRRHTCRHTLAFQSLLVSH
jgi:hypothetical protein